MVTAKKFLCAWRTIWEREKHTRSEAFAKKGSTWGDWTKEMLRSADKPTFLERVAKELEYLKHADPTYHGKCYQFSAGLNIDMVLIGDYNKGYPYKFDVVIEHENDQYPENEMWKLMLLRSPLKVIIFYEHEKEWFEEKVVSLANMLKDADRKFPENQNTEYLLITGKHKDNMIRWRAWNPKEENPSPKDIC